MKRDGMVSVYYEGKLFYVKVPMARTKLGVKFWEWYALRKVKAVTKTKLRGEE